MALKKFLPFLLAFVLPLFLVYAWWGGFATVEIGETEAPARTYAYQENKGDYSKLPEVAVEVRQALLGAGIEPGLPITVLYSNPDLVDVGERVARTGYLVPEGTTVKPPLTVTTLPARKVLRARVRAGSLLAPSRVYVALDEYQQARSEGIRMPTVEIYEPSDSPTRMGQLTVEMDRP